MFACAYLDPLDTEGPPYLSGRDLLQLSRQVLFICVEVLRSSQPTEVMSSPVSLPNIFNGQA